MRAKTFKQFVNERFEEMKKPSFLDRVKKKGRRLLNLESNEDRETLDRIYNAITKGYITDVRSPKEGIAIGWMMNKSLVVDTESGEIIFAGKELQVQDAEREARQLYFELIAMIER